MPITLLDKYFREEQGRDVPIEIFCGRWGLIEEASGSFKRRKALQRKHNEEGRKENLVSRKLERKEVKTKQNGNL